MVKADLVSTNPLSVLQALLSTDATLSDGTCMLACAIAGARLYSQGLGPAPSAWEPPAASAAASLTASTKSSPASFC
jgi:hypothetical protein